MNVKTLSPKIQNEVDLLRDIMVGAAPVEQIYLFGSQVYGTPTPDSDIDLYVILKDDAPGETVETRALLRRAVRARKTMPLDLLVSKKSRFNYRSAAPTLEQEVVEKGMKIYG